MSKQLTFSAMLSTATMAAVALVLTISGRSGGNDTKAATAHGSIVSVLLRA